MSRWPSLFQSQRGAAAMSIVLGFMALVVPMVTATLAFTATSSLASREARLSATSQFSVAGAMDYAVYKIVKVPAFRASLSPGVPSFEIITLNGSEGAISWTKRDMPGGTPPDDPPTFATTLVVDTASVPANTPTTVTYTVEVTNIGTATATVEEVRNGLPRNVDYVNGSTTGVTTANPTQTSHSFKESSGESGTLPFKQLRWVLDVPLGPSESLSINYDAEVNSPDAWVCNSAWTIPDGHDAGTGPTAKIQVGTPAGTLCNTEALLVTKTVTPDTATAGVESTFTYRIEIENVDTVPQEYQRMIDLLPDGLSYVGGSQVTTFNPILNGPLIHYDGTRQLLRWQAKESDDTLAPGEMRYMEFQVSGTLEQGLHLNEVWVYFTYIGDHVYSFPTAEITIWDVYDLSVANDKTSAKAQVWMAGGEKFRVTQWQVTGEE